MKVFFTLLFLCLSLKFVLCEICSENFHRAFEESFNLTGQCGDCLVFGRGMSFRGKNWTGFCLGDEYFMFPGWKCRKKDDSIKGFGLFVRITKISCKFFEGKYQDLDEKCLEKYNAEECKRNFPSGLVREVEKGLYVLPRPDTFQIGEEDWRKGIFLPGRFVGTDTSRLLTERRRSAREAFHRESTFNEVGKRTTELTPSTDCTTTNVTTTTPSTTIPSTTTPSTTTPSTTTTTSSTTPSTTPSTTTTTTITTSSTTTLTSTIWYPTWYPTTWRPGWKRGCEYREVFFQDHCYVLLGLERKQILKRQYSFWSSAITAICRSFHPDALGVAVETVAENNFLKDYIWISYFPLIILTSGVRLPPDMWVGWNIKIDPRILKPMNSSDAVSGGVYSLIENPYPQWNIIDEFELNDTRTMHLLCERPYNPRNIQIDLHEKCLYLYRKSPCYNPSKHVKYCCAMSETGDIQFGCPGTITWIRNENITCQWNCMSDGFFYQPFPKCFHEFFNCSRIRENILYEGAPGKYAIVSNCPKPLVGQSSWYCNSNRTFIGYPDYTLCCGPTQKMCRDTDTYLNVWMGCSSTNVTKTVTCPPGSTVKKVTFHWYCGSDGHFLGNPPDYSKCNGTEVQCLKVDKYGREWTAKVGETKEENCPDHYTGNCFWKCEASGQFDGAEPDCSKCRHAWMDDVDEMIKNGTDSSQVLEKIEKVTEDSDLTLGYGHVLDLTSGCVSLFKEQYTGDEISVFDNFMKGYTKVLKNVVVNLTMWSSFSVSNRRNFSDQILNTTKEATFTNLEIKSKINTLQTPFNTTLATSKKDGFDFFVSYSSEFTDSKFPLEDYSQNDWQLEVKEVQGDGTFFAAMGLVIEYPLSSLLFPEGYTTQELKMNAPVITFTIAASSGGEVVMVPNVTVDISFTHISEIRFPATQVIRRKLHKGETPSGVFNSSLCQYYRGSDWSPDGCWVTFTSKTQTKCRCQHLSTIGLLMSLHKYERDVVLEVISIICSCITIISLIFAITVFWLLDPDKNERSLIGKNLCFCLLCGHFMLLTVMDKKFFFISDGLCTTYALLLHYVFTAAFAWMFLEGCHLYRMLVIVFDSVNDYRFRYLAIGYGVPFAIVIVTGIIGIAFQELPYGQDELCWLKVPNYIWAFMGPVITCTLINLFILIISMKSATTSKMRMKKANFKIWLKGWISLSTLLGITWLFGLSFVNYNVVFVYCFVILNGLQGFFIFLFRCLLNEHYKAYIRKKFKMWFPKHNSESSKKNETKTTSNLFGVSASKISKEMEKQDSGYDTPVLGRETQTNITQLSHTNQNNSEATDKDATQIQTTSEAYFRNKLLETKFSSRKIPNKTEEKGKIHPCIDKDFPELSYHDNYK